MKPQLKKIIYIPDPRKREKKLSEYLLEFEIEALSMFKTVLVISEYLYRLRELELLSKGVKPLPVEFPTKERRKERKRYTQMKSVHVGVD